MQLILAPDLPGAFERIGLTYPGDSEPGRLRRFATNRHKDDTAGWLKVFPDLEGAVFGDWRSGESWTWQQTKEGPPPDAATQAAIRKHAEEARKAAEAERDADYRDAAKKAVAVWQQSAQVGGDHPYLSAKRIGPHVARLSPAPNGWLSIPVFDKAGNLQSLQAISPTGEKRFLPGGKMQGGRVWLGEPTDSGPLVLCEGFATGASIREATGWPVCVTFTAGNLRPVACDVRKHYPLARLVIAGDDDRHTEGNPGRAKAQEAAKVVQGLVVFPTFAGLDGNDFNDMAQQVGRDAVRRLIQDTAQPRRFRLSERTAARLFQGAPPPVRWLVQGIFPLGVPAVLASPPGIGKSFMALGLAAKVAERPDPECPSLAFGGIVRCHGRAVYVSAEDDEPELHRRLYNLCGMAMPERLHVLSLPNVGHFGIIEADRQTRGYRPTAAWRELAEEIRELAELRLVVLDTLQALTIGDTNTAEAVQPLMNEAAALATTTGATVLLIHHVAKGSTKEIRSALDAAEAIRGSGAVVGSTRAAYVLWPPADGGRAVCETLGEPFEENRVAFGMVAKTNGEARRDRTVFLRDERGILRDRTQQYQALSGGNPDSMQAELLHTIRTAWSAGQAFAASAAGHNGMHARRFELPEAFHDKTRQWFDEQTGRLLGDGNIKRLPYRGGARLVPAEVETAIPTESAERTPEGEADSREAGK